MGLLGVDISSYQGDVDFAKVKHSGHGGFVYAKCTEGRYTVDDRFREYHDGCKANGIPFGAYHFFHFGTSIADQVANFKTHVDGRQGQLLPMVDVESDSLNGCQDLAEMEASLALFLKMAGPCVLYTGYAFWNADVDRHGKRIGMNGSSKFENEKLWVAEYNGDLIPSIPTGFQKWNLWQYSSVGQVDGIKGNVDLDRLSGYDLSVISR